MIRLTCPRCEKSFRAADAEEGDVLTCPDCGKRVRVPERDKEDAGSSGQFSKDRPWAAAGARRPRPKAEKADLSEVEPKARHFERQDRDREAARRKKRRRRRS